jgi:hypothetical protein
MRYFPLASKQLANAQSEEWWEAVLGRARLPQDGTRFLFATIVNPNDESQAYLVVDDVGYNMIHSKLTAQQQSFVDSKLLPASDPGVVATLAAIAETGPT